MIDKNFNGEQPYPNSATSAAAAGFDIESIDSKDGSPLGKFKDVESLMKAYNNLQSEFTKKCQAYNELIKNKDDNVDKTPSNKDIDWQIKVDEFLKKYPSAKDHLKNIADVLSSDKNADSSISLEEAYGVVLENENMRLTKMLNDEKRVELAISPKMKEQIIKEYLTAVNHTPHLISSGGGKVVLSNYKKPQDFATAKEMAEKLFK